MTGMRKPKKHDSDEEKKKKTCRMTHRNHRTGELAMAQLSGRRINSRGREISPYAAHSVRGFIHR
jgi:hypothetical protein